MPGRFDVLYGRGITVIVDYAHTPEGLERLLGDVRVLQPEGRLITVFGAGGDRDRSKRPEMGRAAVRGSDLTVVTSDNPRSEAPDAIIDAVMSGVGSDSQVRSRERPTSGDCPGHRECSSRRRGGARGKGHESTQTVGELVIPLDDREIARELLRSTSC